MRKNKKDKKQDINYLDLIPETNQYDPVAPGPEAADHS